MVIESIGGSSSEPQTATSLYEFVFKLYHFIARRLSNSKQYIAEPELVVTPEFLDRHELYHIEKLFQIFTNIPDDAKVQLRTNTVFTDFARPVHGLG